MFESHKKNLILSRNMPLVVEGQGNIARPRSNQKTNFSQESLSHQQRENPTQDKRRRDFPGHPTVKTWHAQCRGHGFNPWSGNQHPACSTAWHLKKKKKEATPVKSSDLQPFQQLFAEHLKDNGQNTGPALKELTVQRDIEK